MNNIQNSNSDVSADNGTKPIVVGSYVRFYDCDRANKDRNYSGEEKYWSVGKVLRRYKTESFQYDSWLSLGGQDVVDIETTDGRISKGHFTNGVSLVSN